MNQTANGSPADRYRDLAAAFTHKVDSFPNDRWSSPSPCPGWDARDVVRHIVDTQRQIVTVVGLELPAAPSVDDDPVAAWTGTRDGMQAVLDDPAQVVREYDDHFGRTTLGETVAGFLSGGGSGSKSDRAGDLCAPGLRSGSISDRAGNSCVQTRVLGYLGRTA